ncbi:hypothetical protein [Hymenobacter metallicola]|uniref:Uncharacterized protein n=1 Tax=Hymenobacter metallicola TaxID=2563114 RepID=A0A4Z0QBS5_9BACT|nr:hypothetical protein [Hymenobacter metallicola]TGE26906.1 hypothetical protein E5K02_10895 [Hymenobacter metallicola]
MPTSAGQDPRRQLQPSTSGPLLLEHLSDEEGWAVLTEQGRQLNPFLRTAPALAYYLAREKLGAHVTNLEALGAEVLQRIARGEKRSAIWQ